MFFDHLENFKEQSALIDDSGTSITYRELAEQADRIGSAASGRCLVFQLCENSVASIVGYVGFLRNRIVPVLTGGDMDMELLNRLLELYHPRYIYLPSQRTGEFPDSFRIVYSYRDYALMRTPYDTFFELHEKLALLLTTSGSTGSPKLVRQSYDNIQSNTESIVRYLQIDSSERPITTLPMNYTYGLSIIQTHLASGASVLITRHPVTMKHFWDFAKKERATSFGGVPYTYEMLKKVRFTRLDLPDLRTMTQAGGKLPFELHREYAEYARATGKNFVVMYGQTEATARMAYLPADKSLEKLGSMGIPVPGGHFRLIDADNREILAPDTVGELIYEGPNVTMGYAECGRDLSKEDEWNQVLVTGDMAKRDSDGFYYIVGRKKRFLKLYGSRVNLDEIDLLIKKEFPGCSCASVGDDQRMITFITSAELTDRVKNYITSTTHINSQAVEIRYIENLPVSSAGKILYKELEKEI